MLTKEPDTMNLNCDYYEVMQISPNADFETIHRVYRIMAARVHPDNPRTGDPEIFLLLKRAYEVLGDPEQRAKYDSIRKSEAPEPLPMFELVDFVYGLKGEVNRRLGVLGLLYNRRRSNPDCPGLSILNLEQRMDFPRERLGFALWYLKAKGYVRQEDNSECGITAEGIDYLEEHSHDDELITRLIAGPSPATEIKEPPAAEEPSSSAREVTGRAHSTHQALFN
jgi:curved DNA-binding protein